MKRFVIASIALLCIGTSHATIINDFTGAYSASNWTIATSGGGSVDNSDSSEVFLTIKNDDNDTTPFSTAEYITVAAGTGIVSFDVFFSALSTTPAPLAHFTAYILDSMGPPEVSISGDIDVLHSSHRRFHFPVIVGQAFGFELTTLPDAFPPRFNKFTADIFSFSAPVTEPSVFFLIGLGLIGLVLNDKRRKA